MKGGMMYEQRDIVLVPFPYSDLTGAKQRPALIISNKKLNEYQDRICCLITSNAPSDGMEIRKYILSEGNLPFQSWIKPHRLFTIHEKIIIKKLATITEKFHDQVIETIIKHVRRD